MLGITLTDALGDGAIDMLGITLADALGDGAIDVLGDTVAFTEGAADADAAIDAEGAAEADTLTEADGLGGTALALTDGVGLGEGKGGADGGSTENPSMPASARSYDPSVHPPWAWNHGKEVTVVRPSRSAAASVFRDSGSVLLFTSTPNTLLSSVYTTYGEADERGSRLHTTQ
jgi:hypothetical protein